MKLKEIPLSIYSELRLKLLNTEKLKTAQEEQIPVIVSLTSIPSRLNRIHVTIRSILDQDAQPKKIILWLYEADKKHVPENLIKLSGDIFSICYTKLNCPHIKLVPSIENFPDSCIVTCDDDFIYDRQWLSVLYKEHLANPKSIIANIIRQIQYDKAKKLLPYKEWNLKNPNNNKTILAIGSSGVLYPPNAFTNQVLDSELFLKLAPKADDLWFKAMAIIANTAIVKTKNNPKQPIPVMGTQLISLKKENVDQNRNVVQWEALTTYFNLNLE